MQNRVLIWGVGYIGFSNMIYYAKSGYTVTGVDIDSEKWDKICKGKELGELSDWISFDYSQLLCGDSVSFITDEREVYQFFDRLANYIK